MNNIEKINDLFQNESFVKQAEEVKDVAELKALLSNNGVELTESEFDNLLSTVAKSETCELNENELQNVSGGASIINFIYKFITYFKKGEKRGGSFHDWENR